jgi:glycosyltransferase involved in cell wall biosynthesis
LYRVVAPVETFTRSFAFNDQLAYEDVVTSREKQPRAQRRSIVLFLKSLNAGGAERAALHLSAELAKHGHDVCFVLIDPTVVPAGDLSAFVSAGIEIVSLECARARSAILPLARLLRRRCPDVLISFLAEPNCVAVLARAIGRVSTRLVITEHGLLSTSGKLLYRCCARGADAIVAVSSGLAAEIAGVCGIPQARVNVIHNPVVTSDFDALCSAPVDETFFVSGVPVFLAVGRLVPEKDYEGLLKAFSFLLAKRKARLAFVGDGPLRSRLLQAAEELGVREHVAFLGFQSNPWRFMRCAAALLVSSRHEGFGNVLVEGMAAGIPVVSTDCPYGPAEILEHGRCGLLVPVGNPGAMALAMETVLERPISVAVSMERARQFTAAAVTNSYTDLIEDLCIRAAPDRGAHQ